MSNIRPNTPSLVTSQSHADTLTYEAFFGLTEKAFSLASDPRFLW